MNKSIWVYLQNNGGSVAEESLMGLSLGRRLAKECSGVLEGVCVGEIDSDFPGALGKIYQLIGKDLQAGYDLATYAEAIRFLWEKERPSLIIFPSTTQGQDLASWLGGWAGANSLVGARGISFRDNSFMAARLEFDGKVLVEYLLEGSPLAVSLEQGVGEIPEAQDQSKPDLLKVEVPGGLGKGSIRVISSSGGAKKVDLRSAKTIVGVGAGVGGKEGFEQARTLASLLGAELGATRAAVDAGWLGHEHQIGQTGAKVKPDLYVACGISGAVQHRVGIMDSGTIVSINLDPQAPIFRFSHYCVVGDVKQVVPKLLELLRR
jgi:electron transfer flavoprotein alpha subunit